MLYELTIPEIETNISGFGSRVLWRGLNDTKTLLPGAYESEMCSVPCRAVTSSCM